MQDWPRGGEHVMRVARDLGLQSITVLWMLVKTL